MRLLAAFAVLVAAGLAASTARSATVAAAPSHCSRHAPSQLRAPAWRRARHVLAPKGAAAVRLCRYSGLDDDPALALVRSVERTRPRLLRRLVRELDALPKAKGAYSCPDDDGSEIAAHFSYPGGHRLTVTVGLGGCEEITNGKVGRLGFLGHGPRLLRQLRRMTR